MKTVGKLVLGLLGGLLLLVVAIVVIVIFSINGVAKAAIEKGGSYALGVPTTVDSVSVGLFSGKFAMSGFEVANPDGFTTPHFLSLGDGAVQVEPASLQSDIVELPILRLETISANLEKKGGQSNYKVILDNLEKVSGGDKPSEPTTGDEKKLVVHELIIRDVNVHVDLLGLPGGGEGSPGAPFQKLTSVDIPIDEIKLTDVGRTGEGVGGTGVTFSELTSIIVQAVLAAAVEKGGDVMPAVILGELQAGLAGLTDLAGLGLDIVAEAPAQVQKLAEEAGKAVEEATKEVENAVEDLKGLIPGQKP